MRIGKTKIKLSKYKLKKSQKYTNFEEFWKTNTKTWYKKTNKHKFKKYEKLYKYNKIKPIYIGITTRSQNNTILTE